MARLMRESAAHPFRDLRGASMRAARAAKTPCGIGFVLPNLPASCTTPFAKPLFVYASAALHRPQPLKCSL